MAKKLAIIGASYLQLPLVKKAKEMGLETHCFAWEKGAVCKDVADFFYPISITEKDTILKTCQTIGIDGIASIASDLAAPTVAYTAEKMGLIGNSYESAVKANNKFLMRETLMCTNIPCPQYRMVKDIDCLNDIDWKYPQIVKPSDRSGSLGVQKVNSAVDLQKAVQNALDVSFKKEAMIEDFIDGREISVEFISYQGIHYPLTITDKVTTGSPYFVELEHHQPSNLSKDEYIIIYNITKRALNALGITNGASHSEYKISNDGHIYVMEIGGRMGGDFIGSDLVRLSTGYDFLRGVVEVAVGGFQAPLITKQSYSGVYFLSKETKYLKPLIENWKKYSEIVYAEITDSDLRAVKCSGDRSGYVIYNSNKKIIYGK